MTLSRKTNDLRPAAIFDRGFGFGWFSFWYPTGGSGAG